MQKAKGKTYLQKRAVIPEKEELRKRQIIQEVSGVDFGPSGPWPSFSLMRLFSLLKLAPHAEAGSRNKAQRKGSSQSQSL